MALLQLFNEGPDDNEVGVEKIRLQKLLFLFTQSQEKAVYDFIPYKYGCFSYSAYADLTAMVNKDMLTETENHFKSNEKQGYLVTLKDTDRSQLLKKKDLKAIAFVCLLLVTKVSHWRNI